MSVDASMEFEFEKPFKVMDVIDKLIHAGWTYNDNGKIVYLPLNDNGLYSWQTASIDCWHDVYDIICEKIRDNELVGLNLTWNDTMVGGQFLFHPDENKKLLSVNLTINRIKIDGTNDTDFSWYIPKIIEAIEEDGYKIKIIK